MNASATEPQPTPTRLESLKRWFNFLAIIFVIECFFTCTTESQRTWFWAIVGLTFGFASALLAAYVCFCTCILSFHSLRSAPTRKVAASALTVAISSGITGCVLVGMVVRMVVVLVR